MATGEGRPVIETGVIRWRAGAPASAPDRVAVESPLEIRIGGHATTVIMRTPGHDEELVLGFLFTEGLIPAASAIRALRRPAPANPAEAGNVIDVETGPGLVNLRKLERHFYASSSCGVCGKSTIASLAIHAPPVASPLRVAPGTLRGMPAALREAQAVFDETGGLHAAGLFDAGARLLALREDVGRHNAVDKLCGWALREARVPLSDNVLLVSGRASFEIVQKAVMAGVPVVAAVSAPSSYAIDLAERYGVTLVGFLRGDGLNVYAHPERIAS